MKHYHDWLLLVAVVLTLAFFGGIGVLIGAVLSQ